MATARIAATAAAGLAAGSLAGALYTGDLRPLVLAEPTDAQRPALVGGNHHQQHTPLPVFRVLPKRLSIYDEDAPPPPPTKPNDPTELELLIRQARHETTKAFATTRQQIQSVASEWIAVEKQIEGVVKTYHDPAEELLPGMIYVTIAGFAGSILANNKNILFRMSAPMAGSIGAFAYFFPSTARSIITQRPITSFPPSQPGDFSAVTYINSVLDRASSAIGFSIPHIPQSSSSTPSSSSYKKL